MARNSDRQEVRGSEIDRGTVRPEWIDFNDHMNVAYYVLAFDCAIDRVWARIGIDDDFIRRTRGSTFAVETHVTYQGELRRDDTYFVTLELLAYDQKRIHQFHRMYHGTKGFLAATAEWMTLHVNLDSRRVQPWPESVLEALAAIAGEQAGIAALGTPAELCGRMRVKSPLFSLHTGETQA